MSYTKFLWKIFPLSLLIIISLNVYSQVQTARYIPVSNSNAFYEYLPQGYNPSGSETYPLILFIHGMGELGPGTSATLPAVLRNGPAKLINQGVFPTSFTVNGVTSKFIVISPQFVYWPGAPEINQYLDYIVSHYKVDLDRIYMTGLSMGGGVVFDFVGGSAAGASRIAAIVPVCGASYPYQGGGNIIANANLPVWATHNDADPTVPLSNTVNYVNYVNNAPIPPTPRAKMTIFNSGSHDAWSRTYDLNFKENNQNIYEWMLNYRRGMTPVTNVPPVVNAGPDKTIPSPGNSSTLDGSASDLNGTITSTNWTKVSGPNATFWSQNNVSASVTGLVPGVYTFRLTATDNNGASASDDLVITVSGTANAAPVANAGTDKTITLPTNSVSLTGSGTDANGTISSYAWSKISGGTATIATASAATTSITGLVPGTYTFRLTVTDNNGATGSDDVTVTVNAANIPPVANAGNDKVVILPTNSTSIAGTATDPNGTISSYVWTKVAGGTVTIANTSSAITSLTGLSLGIYTFRLTVTDNNGAIASDDVTVTVVATPNTAPVANAGTDKTITLPTNSTTLTGSGTDANGSVTGYSWTKISGGAATITSASAASTTITGLVQGVYTFRLTVTDNNGATASDDVQVTVNGSAVNTPPVANAGADISIVLPVTTVTLNGMGTDQDGTISRYQWTKISGSAVTFGASSAPITTISGLSSGAYTFRLTVTDNSGASATDDVLITVASQNSQAVTQSLKVNVYGGTNPYTNPEWNNWNTNVQGASAPLKYSNGSASTITSTLSSQTQVVDNGSTYASTTTICPKEVLRYNSYSTAARQLKIRGLKRNATYRLEFYASRAWKASQSIFKIGRTADTVNTFNNRTDFAKFSNVVPDSTGSIVVDITKIGQYNYLAGFILTESVPATAGRPGSDVTETISDIKAPETMKAELSANVYPNPVQGMLTINVSVPKANQQMFLTVHDANGKIVLQSRKANVLQKENVQINMSSLSTGIYFLNIRVGTESIKKEIFKY